MDEIEQVLAFLDAETARLARPAVLALSGSEHAALGDVTRARLQRFLWQQLPETWPVSDEKQHHEIAWALGDLFYAVRLVRLAETCRDPRTHRIIAAWHVDKADGARLAEESLQRIGAVLPATSLLAFGATMHPQEARVHALISQRLEQAVDAGRLEPGGIGFLEGSRRLTERFLLEPSPEFDGRTALSAVRLERMMRWEQTLNLRQPLVDAGLLRSLADGAPVPSGVELSLAPARALLAAVGEGVTLGADGRLPSRLSEVLDERFGWTGMLPGPSRAGGEIVQLNFVRDHLSAQELLLQRADVLTLSAAGQMCLSDLLMLWRAVTEPAPRWREGFAHDVLAVTTAILLQTDTIGREGLIDEVAHLLSAKWRAEGDVALYGGVEGVFLGWWRAGVPLGWWEERRRRTLCLTRFGRAAAAGLFGAVTAAPSR